MGVGYSLGYYNSIIVCIVYVMKGLSIVVEPGPVTQPRASAILYKTLCFESVLRKKNNNK